MHAQYLPPNHDINWTVPYKPCHIFTTTAWFALAIAIGIAVDLTINYIK